MGISEDEELPRVMREICEALGADTAILTIHPDNGEEPVALYVDHADVPEQTAATLVAGRSLWPSPDPGEAHRWLRCEVAGVQRDILSMPVQRIPGHSRLVISALFGELSKERKKAAEEVYLARRPFAVGYFRLWQIDRTRQRRIGALETSLDLTDLGVMLLDRSANVSFANIAAKKMLDERDGLRRHGNGVAATALQDGVRLQVAINHVVDRHGPSATNRRASLLRLERSEGPPLVVSVLPTDQPLHEESDIAAIMYVVDPAIDIERLLQPICKVHHLSPVETKFVCLLTKGATIAEAATAMRIKEQTARSALKQVFQKTGTNRQAELIRVMFTNLVRTSRTVPIEVL